MAALDYIPPPEDDIQEPPNNELSDVELQSIVAMEIENAVNFIESDIAPDRVTATEYYRGLPFGDEEQGRSQFISRDVHDTVNSIVPGLMRIFFGPEHVVEYSPSGPNDVEMAEQATDYANYIFTKDNPGFLILHSLVKDLLIRKCGIVKYDWDSSRQISVQDYSGLDILQIVKMDQDFKAEGTEVEIINGQLDPNGTASCRLKLKRSRDGVKIEALPLEEFFINSDARGFGRNEFRIMGHARNLPHSQLIAMGYSEEELAEAGGQSDWRDNSERQARMPQLSGRGWEDSPGDASQKPILYVEAFTYVDVDRDGIAELWKFCCAGAGYKILRQEIVDDHPFAEFPCDPEPHISAIAGASVADKTLDIQKTKSGVLRATFDSLSLSVVPRTVVKKTGVNIDDVLNTEIGAIIRADDVDNVKPLITPFVGQDSFPLLSYLDEVRENRTGMSRVSMGLDPQALQNVTAMAAANQFNKSHEMQEMIARVMAETGFKRLFRGILRLITQNQRKPRMINLRGRFVQIDPRAYKADMEVTANVALGATDRDKIAALQGVLAKQEQIIATGGLNNPLVSLKEYYNTLSKMLSMIGFKNVNSFFKDPSLPQNPPPSPPPPDPKIVNDQAKIKLEFIKHQNEMAQKTADRDQETILKLYEINVRNKTALDVATIRGQFEAMRIAADLHIQASEAKHAAKQAAA